MKFLQTFETLQIKSGEVYATINQKDGMVVFKDNPEKYDSADRFLKIQEDMNSVMELNKRIKKMEEEVKLNPMVSVIYFV